MDPRNTNSNNGQATTSNGNGNNNGNGGNSFSATASTSDTTNVPAREDPPRSSAQGVDPSGAPAPSTGPGANPLAFTTVSTAATTATANPAAPTVSGTSVSESGPHRAAAEPSNSTPGLLVTSGPNSNGSIPHVPMVNLNVAPGERERAFQQYVEDVNSQGPYHVPDITVGTGTPHAVNTTAHAFGVGVFAPMVPERVTGFIIEPIATPAAPTVDDASAPTASPIQDPVTDPPGPGLVPTQETDEERAARDLRDHGPMGIENTPPRWDSSESPPTPPAAHVAQLPLTADGIAPQLPPIAEPPPPTQAATTPTPPPRPTSTGNTLVPTDPMVSEYFEIDEASE